MKLIQLALVLYVTSNLISAESFQCRERTSCQHSYLETQTSEGLHRIYNLVKQELSGKIRELTDYHSVLSEYITSNKVGEYLSERLAMGLPELADLRHEFGQSMRNFLITADRNGKDEEIKNQLIQHSSAVPLQELIRLLENARESSESVINREKLTRLISTVKNNKLCVRSFIKRLIDSTDGVTGERDGAVLYERLRILLGAIRALASPIEARLAIGSIREVLGRYRMGDTCRKALTANIACRICNNSVAGSLPRACKGLCASTLWVCLAPLLQALRGSNDVIRYRRALAEILSTQNGNMNAAVPSIGSIAKELEALTLRAIQRIHTQDLVRNLTKIAEACDFTAQLSDMSNAIGEISTETDSTDGDVDRGREVQLFSFPLPPQRLLPLFKGVIATLCAGNSSGFHADTGRCWNGTQVAPFLYNTDLLHFSLQTVEILYRAAGVVWDREAFLAETAAISGATDPCAAIQGDSEVYYTAVSETQSACFEERRYFNSSSHLHSYLPLIALAISLVLYIAFLL